MLRLLSDAQCSDALQWFAFLTALEMNDQALFDESPVAVLALLHFIGIEALVFYIPRRQVLLLDHNDCLRDLYWLHGFIFLWFSLRNGAARFLIN